MLNRPTARFIATILLEYGGGENIGIAEDAAELIAYALASARFGRQRRWAALDLIAPDLADVLRAARVDIRYVWGIEPRDIRAVQREIDRANKWIDEKNGGQAPPHVLLGNAWQEVPDERTWQREVWEITNSYRRFADRERATSG